MCLRDGIARTSMAHRWFVCFGQRLHAVSTHTPISLPLMQGKVQYCRSMEFRLPGVQLLTFSETLKESVRVWSFHRFGRPSSPGSLPTLKDVGGGSLHELPTPRTQSGRLG
jgi:hypothetical protein